MCRLRVAVFLCLVWIAGNLAFGQQTVYVDDNTCPGVGTGTQANPYCKIQDAICSIRATGGGTVLVNPGTYNEAIRMFAGVSVVSTDGPSVTTIDATGKTGVESSSCTALRR